MPLLFENKSAEEKQLTHDWIAVRAYVNEHFGKRPDMNMILYLIGVNELGQIREFSKEEKQDLMHIAICKLFENTFYKLQYIDHEGWPHYENIDNIPSFNLRDQENLLKIKVVEYFKKNIF